jgi:hypothetical protein
MMWKEKRDMHAKIGTTAGKIYHYLQRNGENSTAVLKKDLKVDDASLVTLGVGWLAREGKVNLRAKGKTLLVSLAPGA